MRILLTSASLPLTQVLATALTGAHQVRLTDTKTVSTGRGTFVRSDLSHEPPTNDLVRGMDAIIHSGDGCAEAGLPVWLGLRDINEDGTMQFGESL
jgi:hypothetical protein